MTATASGPTTARTTDIEPDTVSPEPASRFMLGGWLAACALVVLFACGSGDDAAVTSTDAQAATPAETPSTTPSSSSVTTATLTGCGVTLADVQALLPANIGVTQNRTPDVGRCNFTWNDNGPRGIDVARVPGGRATFEQQSPKVPSEPKALKDGTPYEPLAGVGERAWAFGDARHANVVVLRGADLFAVDLVIDGPPPTGSRTTTGLDTRSLEVCQALAKKAVS